MSLRDHRSDLLISPKRAAQHLDEIKPQLLLEKCAGGSGRKEIVLSQRVTVETSPIEQVLLLVVVSYESDSHLMTFRSLRKGIEPPYRPDVSAALRARERKVHSCNGAG